MACCTSLPYFATNERQMEAFVAEISTDELVMYESDEDGEFQQNIRRKCLTLLTEACPQSPLSTDDELTSPPTCPTGCCLSVTETSFCAGSPLLNDCMWSAGMLPPDLMAARLTSPRPQGKDTATTTTVRAETDAVCTAVDPSLISPCPQRSVTSSAVARHHTSVGTPPSSDADDDDVDRQASSAAAGEACESSDEVDVVSVNACQYDDCDSSRLSSSSGRQSTAVRDLLALPPACSVLARVTAMHNYSSAACLDHPTSTSSARSPPSGGGMYSAPQSPSLSTTSVPRHRLDRSVSTPASPCPPARRRRRIIHRRLQRTAMQDESSASDDDSDAGMSPLQRPPHLGTGKRAHHNVLERRRRDHLKWNFEALRAAVPGSAGDARVPKVAILRRASDHIRQLSQTSQRLSVEYSRLRCLHERWLYKLDLLGKQHQILPAPPPHSNYVVQPAA